MKTLVKKNFVQRMTDNGFMWIFLAFVFPVAIMTAAFANSGMHPFGENQILVVDMWHQYFPFFRVVRDKLTTSGSSFFYSWETGMGTNFLSMISYYAMSPLNWIAALFKEQTARDVFMFVLIGKIGFSGAFFACFLKYTFKRNDASLTVFAMMYAMCSYTLGYYWNIMWFDTVALLPLVMLGVVAIAREGKWRLFTATLMLSLVSNYYIGFFTCIFTVMFFAVATACEWQGIKKAFKGLWIIIRSSLLGIALGGFILLPAYRGLQLTHSANNAFPQNKEWYEKWYDIFGNMLSFSKPSYKEGLPNFASGMLCLVLIGVFLSSLKVRWREKISVISLLAVIAVSCNLNKLNFIWHGFHFTNMIPYRFAFLFSFVLIAASFRAFDIIMTHGIKVYHLIATVIFPSLVIWLYSKSNGEAVSAAWKGTNNNVRKSVYIILIFIAIFVFAKIISVFIKNKVLLSYMTAVLMCVTVGIELYHNAWIGIGTVGSSGYTTYPDQNDNIQALISTAKQKDGDLFFRSEMKTTYTLNDGALYGYNGISQFSSMANVNITKFMKNMGLYASNAGNRYFYRVSTPVVNSLFNIKYVMARSGGIASDPYGLTEFATSGLSSIYKANFPLSLGFMADNGIMRTVPLNNISPFEYQNELMKNLTGYSENLYERQPVALLENEGTKVEKRSNGSYYYQKEEGSGTATVSYTFRTVENARLYGYVTNGAMSTVTASAGEATIGGNMRTTDRGISVEDYPITFPIGDTPEDGAVKLTLTFSNDKESGSNTVMVYAMNTEVWEKFYAKLASSQLKITEFKDNHIKGIIDAKEDGILFTSIPYEKGWSVYVDGRKTETKMLVDSLLGVNVSAGEHKIELKYYPDGFKSGITVSIISLMLCITFTVLDKKKIYPMFILAGKVEEGCKKACKPLIGKFKKNKPDKDVNPENAEPTDAAVSDREPDPTPNAES